MNKIQQTIDRVLSGKLNLETRPMYCLRAHRQLVEAANGWPSGAYYSKVGITDHLTATNRRLAPTVPWARSLEQTFIDKGMTVPVTQAKAGDVVFSRLPANEGHVGTLGLEHGVLHVLENSTARRGRSFGGSLNWVPLSQWSGLTTVGRLPREWVETEDTPTLPPTLPASQQRKRVVVTSGTGQFVDRSGQRFVLPLVEGYSLVVNDTDPDTTWIDIRQGAN